MLETACHMAAHEQLRSDEQESEELQSQLVPAAAIGHVWDCPEDEGEGDEGVQEDDD
jgi:hypothetical protein